MTFEQLQLWSFDQTEKEADILIKAIAEQYRIATVEIVKSLQENHLRYLSNSKPEDFYNIMIQRHRLENLFSRVFSTYKDYARRAGATVEQVSSIGIVNTFYRKQYAIGWLSDVGLSFSELDDRLVRLSVTGTVESWKKISEKLKSDILINPNKLPPQYGTLSELINNNRTRHLAKMQTTITQSFIQGHSIQRQARQIRDAMENASYQAERIARTEFTRTANTGSQLASIDAKNKGLNIMRQWVATLDESTRPRHARYDGKLAEVDGPFDGGVMRPGAFENVGDNVNCRCTTIDVFIDEKGEVESPRFRRGRNPQTGKNEVIKTVYFDEWASANGLKKNKYGQFYKVG